MTEETTTMQAQAEAAMDNQRPPLDAIAEDLVAKPVGDPAPEAPEPTPQAREVQEAPDVEADQDDLTDDLDESRGEEQDENAEEGDLLARLKGDNDPGEEPEQVSAEPGDDTVYRVKVDGEDQEITLGELKANYSAEGAIDKRLQDATEARTRAEQEASGYIDQVKALHDRLNHVYQHYNGVLFAPMVQQPPMEMRETDPIGYSHAMEDYRADQDRIRSEQLQMQQTLHQVQQVTAQQQQNYMKEQADALRAKFPGLNSRENATAFKQTILDIGQAHGFTPEEISVTADHRLLSLAAEAAAYRELKASMDGKRDGKTATVKHRPMPTRGDNRPKTEKSRQAVQRRKAVAKARETGSLDDVAATLLK